MERHFAVQSALKNIIVSAPDMFLDCDVVEIRVSLTPMCHGDYLNPEPRQNGDAVYSEVRILRLEAKDTRMIGHLVRELIRNLLREYLQIDW